MQMADSTTGSSASTVPWTPNDEPIGLLPWSTNVSSMVGR